MTKAFTASPIFLLTRKKRMLSWIRNLNRYDFQCAIGDPYRFSALVDAAPHNDIATHKRFDFQFPFLTRTFVLVSALVLVSTVAASAATDTDVLPVVEVAPGVFVHQGVHGLMDGENHGAIANIGFVIGNAAVAVVDTGGSRREGEALLRAIRTRTSLPVRWVINTHMHPDHVFGNAAFLGPDVAFVGHARLGPALAARFPHYLAANASAMGADLLDGTVEVQPTVAVEDRSTIDLGGRTLELRAWPVAHTDNDLTVFDEETGTLFTGDLVFLEHLPSIDGSLRGWQRVLVDLAALPAKRVIPGHGPLDAPWPAALEPQARYFEVLARDLRASIDAGESLSEAVTSAGRSEAEAWVLFDEFNTRNATAAFAELEWE